jgi:hypothetical protein
MADFDIFQNVLPDPNNTFVEAGGSLNSNGVVVNTGVDGPGYASVKLASEQPLLNTRTNSGRLISRSLSGHKWNIDISYNPMTREEFEPVSSFIMQQKASLQPFFVSLPQYRVPRDPTFATYAASNEFTAASSASNGIAGQTTILVARTGYSSVTNGKAKPGDIFTITDGGDFRHTKVYQITRVEVAGTHLSTGTDLGVTQQLLHFNPPLTRTLIASQSVINFHDPKFRVIFASDLVEYSLNTNNLYSFSLKLEEALR